MRKDETSPNLFNFAPINTWREFYRGRWDKLTKVQRIEFLIEIVFFTLFFGGVIYAAYFRNGHFIGLILAFGTVGAVLGGFFFLLTRDIR
jgi:hypothetical protein